MIWSFLFAILTVANFAFADEVNLLKNNGFESRTSQWSKTGSSTFTIESAAPLTGIYSGLWDASATGEFFRSSTYTIPAGLKGATCLIQMKYLWDSGTTGHILMNVDDGTNNVATLSLAPTSGAVPRFAQASFTCPTSGTLRFELESTANAVAITVDDMFVGTGKNSVQIAQAELFGAVNYANIANCEVSTTSGTVAEVADDADCTSRQIVGNASFVNNQFKMRFTNGIPAGRYELTTMVPAYVTGASTACEFYIRSSSGVGSSMSSHYAVLDTAGNAQSNPRAQTVNIAWNQAAATAGPIDFYMEWRRTAGAGTCFMGTAQAGGAVFSMSLKRYPLQSAEALTLETTGWKVDANISGANPSLGTAAVTTYTGIEDTALSLVNNTGSNVLTAQIPCSSTNPSTGTTCAAGNESVGVAFNIPAAGDVLACASASWFINPNVSSTIHAAFQVVETSNTSQTIIQEGKSRIPATFSSPAAGGLQATFPMRVCGVFSFSSAGQKTLRLMYEQNLGTGTIASSQILADANTNIGQRDIHWEVYPINQQMPAPVFTELQNNVKSVQNGEKVVRARINNNGSTCPIIHQSGSWISSVSRSGTGVCAITIAGGVFSGAPACVVISAGGAADVANQGAVTPTSTAVTISTFVATSGAANDKAFDIICMGPN